MVRSSWLGKAVELFPEGSAECVSFLSGAFDGGEHLLEEVGRVELGLDGVQRVFATRSMSSYPDLSPCLPIRLISGSMLDKAIYSTCVRILQIYIFDDSGVIGN